MRKTNLSVAFLSFLVVGCVGAAPTSQAVTVPSSPCDVSSIVALVVTAPPSMIAGTTSEITATGIDTLGNHIDVTKDVTWITSNVLMASAMDGKVHGIGTGRVTLTATLGEVSSSANVDVVKATLLALTIRGDAETAWSGSVTSWHVSGRFDDGTITDITSSAAWSTSDPGIALVEKPGAIRAVKGGMAMVSASVDGQVVSAPLMVSDPAMIELRVDAPTTTTTSGNVVQMAATAVYEDGSTVDMTSQVGWYSSDGSVATVWQGQTSTVSSGVVTIFASVGDWLGSVDLVVN